EGIYGVEAAAQYYWGSGVSNLNHWEAAQLAATLPSPIKHNPATRTATFIHRTRKIYNAQHLK
ncbi:MAG: transglycosylase domain-containing protein, partial [Gammaproteobacteria bacterium]|nr:transglycosylase domain-containing protein [Gammaproteobacteria bacterium]